MVNDFQHLSRSQFVLTYGPGSIIETTKGPRLIPTLAYGLGGDLLTEDTFDDFEIPDVRLCNYIQKSANVKNPCRILALPSNAGLRRRQNSRVYSTYQFPSWKVCYRKNDRKHDGPILFRGDFCPECGTSAGTGAVRFVAACSAGHLDDVDWHRAVHGPRRCKPKYYKWSTSGSSLGDIRITCPDCQATTTMEAIYRKKFPCSGRNPENESKLKKPMFIPGSEGDNQCQHQMRITQRQSTSLRVADTVTVLTIPDFDNNLSRILQQKSVINTFNTLALFYPDYEGKNEDTFIAILKGALKNNNVPHESSEIILSEIEKIGVKNILDRFFYLNKSEVSFLEIIYQEFESLMAGAGTHSPNFIMGQPESTVPDQESVFPCFQVFPVHRIRTVTVQTGYRRMVGVTDRAEAKSVSSAIPFKGDRWYPGYAGFGEGIFITFKDRFPDLNGKGAPDKWKQHDPATIENTEWANIYSLPEFVWLHTLSHALIKAVAQNTGYSSASIRERVYLSRDLVTGGVLLYNTSPGDDSGMGGLAGLASGQKFGMILNTVKEILQICSNDPLCIEMQKTPETMNGAACYSCLLMSETSCEHRNLWLDRHMLLD